MFLSREDFATVVRSTPLVSIDLLVENRRGEYLLGRRNNRPAQGFWFVPGGRVQKDETLACAFERLTRAELGQTMTLGQGRFYGVWQHFYGDNFGGEDFSTHYIVLGFRLQVDSQALRLPVKVSEDLALGLVGLPVGFAGIPAAIAGATATGLQEAAQ